MTTAADRSAVLPGSPRLGTIWKSADLKDEVKPISIQGDYVSVLVNGVQRLWANHEFWDWVAASGAKNISRNDTDAEEIEWALIEALSGRRGFTVGETIELILAKLHAAGFEIVRRPTTPAPAPAPSFKPDDNALPRGADRFEIKAGGTGKLDQK